MAVVLLQTAIAVLYYVSAVCNTAQLTGDPRPFFVGQRFFRPRCLVADPTFACVSAPVRGYGNYGTVLLDVGMHRSGGQGRAAALGQNAGAVPPVLGVSAVASTGVERLHIAFLAYQNAVYGAGAVHTGVVRCGFPLVSALLVPLHDF